MLVKKMRMGDYLITGEVVIIGLAAAVHLVGVVTGWSVSRCALLLAGAAAGGLGGILLFLIWKIKGDHAKGDSWGKRPVLLGREKVLYGLFLLLFLSQLIFLCVGNTVYRGGDMTVETVGSFLATDAIYQVNPMTGQAYTQGIPSRLKILCLPTLYGSLCKWTGLPPVTVIRGGVPILVLCSCYMAFGLLAYSLFPENGETGQRTKRAIFMTVVSFLLWAGTYENGMDGFNLLCSGWRGVTIRNMILVPWLLSLCIRRLWKPAVLCILAEACIVWTLYGCGVCLFVAAGMAVTQLFCRKYQNKQGN